MLFSPVAATTAGRGAQHASSLQDIFSSKRNMRQEKRIIFYNMLEIGAELAKAVPMRGMPILLRFAASQLPSRSCATLVSAPLPAVRWRGLCSLSFLVRIRRGQFEWGYPWTASSRQRHYLKSGPMYNPMR